MKKEGVGLFLKPNKSMWMFFVCEVRCCNAEKPVPGNNIVRQDCSGEHGELRDGQRCNVVGVASKELLPCIKWALLLKHPNIGGATQARTSLPWFLRPGLHTVRKIFLNKEFLSIWEMRLPQKWALHDDSNDTQQLYVVSHHAKTFTLDYSSVLNWSHVVTIWNIPFIWIISFLQTWQHHSQGD